MGYYLYGIMCVGVWINFVIEVIGYSNFFFGIKVYFFILICKGKLFIDNVI